MNSASADGGNMLGSPEVELRVKTLQDMNLAAEPRLVVFRTNANKDFTDLMSELSVAETPRKITSPQRRSKTTGT